MEYGALVDIGRDLVGGKVKRPFGQRVGHALLRRTLLSPWFGVAFRMGRLVRPLLPEILRAKIPQPRPAGTVPRNTHVRTVLMPVGCVQPTMMPSIDAATIRVLDAVGIGVRLDRGSGCCGAINFHLDAQERARDQMRANIDAWLPLLENGTVEAIVSDASGCGAMIKEYAHHLKHDPAYADKARRLIDKVVDVAEIVAPHAADLAARLHGLPARVAFHPPCTLQHWQNLRGVSERLLADLGFNLVPFAESHLCCGSAGTYSVTQPELSKALRARKLGHILEAKPDCIVSSNIGCIGHLQTGTDLPVRHWIEVVDQALSAAK